MKRFLFGKILKSTGVGLSERMWEGVLTVLEVIAIIASRLIDNDYHYRLIADSDMESSILYIWL